MGETNSAAGVGGSQIFLLDICPDSVPHLWRPGVERTHPAQKVCKKQRESGNFPREMIKKKAMIINHSQIESQMPSGSFILLLLPRFFQIEYNINSRRTQRVGAKNRRRQLVRRHGRRKEADFGGDSELKNYSHEKEKALVENGSNPSRKLFFFLLALWSPGFKERLKMKIEDEGSKFS